MRDTELFEAALGLSSPWVVLRSEFDPDQKQLDLLIGFARGSRFACPACGAEGCGVHDVREREWRHRNFFQHKTVLKASIPRVSCDNCGVKQVSPRWARTGSGFTLLFEAFLLSMVKAMPVPQSPNKSPGAAPHDRFCGPQWLRRSQLQVVDHLLAFVVAQGESRRHGVQPGRVAPLLRAHGASPPFQRNGARHDCAAREPAV